MGSPPSTRARPQAILGEFVVLVDYLSIGLLPVGSPGGAVITTGFENVVHVGEGRISGGHDHF